MKTRVEELQARIKDLESGNATPTVPPAQHSLPGSASGVYPLTEPRQQQAIGLPDLTLRPSASAAIMSSGAQGLLSGLTTPGQTGTTSPHFQDQHLPFPLQSTHRRDSSDGLTRSVAAAGIQLDPLNPSSPQQELDFSLWMTLVSEGLPSKIPAAEMCDVATNQQTFQVSASSSTLDFISASLTPPAMNRSSSSGFDSVLSTASFPPTQQSVAARNNELSGFDPSDIRDELRRPRECSFEPTAMHSDTDRLEHVARHARTAGFEDLDDMIATYYRCLSHDQIDQIGDGTAMSSRRLPRMIATLRHAVAEWRDWERRGFPLD